MRKKICFFLLASLIFIGLNGCQKDEIIIRNDFTNTEGEKIDFVLENIPACLVSVGDSTALFCYADYAYEYFFDHSALLKIYENTKENSSEIEANIINKRFEVLIENFNEYAKGITPPAKVYVSAKVTNIATVVDTEDWQFGGITPLCRKAYLTDIRLQDEL